MQLEPVLGFRVFYQNLGPKVEVMLFKEMIPEEQLAGCRLLSKSSEYARKTVPHLGYDCPAPQTKPVNPDPGFPEALRFAAKCCMVT